MQKKEFCFLHRCNYSTFVFHFFILFFGGGSSESPFFFIDFLLFEFLQIHNILMSEVKGFNQQSQELLSAGLEEAPYIRVDDTGAKHHHQNGYWMHIGGQYFA